MKSKHDERIDTVSGIGYGLWKNAQDIRDNVGHELGSSVRMHIYDQFENSAVDISFLMRALHVVQP